MHTAHWREVQSDWLGIKTAMMHDARVFECDVFAGARCGHIRNSETATFPGIFIHNSVCSLQGMVQQAKNKNSS